MVNRAIWNIFEYVLCSIETILLYVFFNQALKSRKNTPKYRGIALGIFSTTIIFLSGYALNNFFVKITINILCFLLIGIILYEGLLKEKAVYVIIYVLFLAIIDIVTFQGMALLLGVSVNEIVDLNTWYTIIMSTLSKLILLALIKGVPKVTHKNLESIPRKFWYMIFIVFSIGIISLVGISEIGFYFKNNERIGLVLIVIALGIFVCNMIIYFTFQKICEYFGKEKEYQMVECQNKMLIKAANENEKYQKEVRKMHHDFNNHISCIDMLLQMNNVEKARKYIQDMLIQTEKTYIKIKLGNDIADSVVNQKYSLARSHHINFTVEGELDQDIPINSVDLCALMSNALDNAIEANLKVEELKKRKINLTIKPHKDYLMINVTNAVASQVNVNHLKTTKKDKTKHGIGLLSMQKVVEKYSGHLKYECKDELFRLSMMLKIVD